ncbi:GNAT family N-acetyltransferase [Paenibacillus macerans]|uniref:GNAT family N-acetyltransferase n=1 Tax=Paenibacillus macerans TaxID=44252 RepID=UPI00203FF66C|nr:GNAT family N-acetyltransferase [Paenibacillus macerans]MCM3704037.1 GNAT family N-acetyltransferase [Paenibacillus macerans]
MNLPNQVISLSLYDEKYLETLERFELPENQAEFTALPSEALDMSVNDPDRYPVVILADGTTLAGFFVLHRNSDFVPLVENPRALLLRALSVDFRHQGKGYAKAAMLQLPPFVREHFPEADEIVLAVNHQNYAAQRLYAKAGFEDRGLTKMGPKGLQHIYHYRIG